MVKVTFGQLSNLWLRMMSFEKSGDCEQGHSHPFDHFTLLSSGSLAVTVNDKTTNYSAPHLIVIAKGQEHQLVATADNTVACCIHPLRTGQREEDIVDPDMIPEGSYEALVRLVKAA